MISHALTLHGITSLPFQFSGIAAEEIVRSENDRQLRFMLGQLGRRVRQESS
jgi:hypothetical protein